MRKEDLKHQIFTIPNILTYLRVVAIPFFMYYTIARNTYILQSAEFPEGFPLIGLIIMVAAASTDIFDGMIARRFHQGSDLGTMLDPLADKLMHTMAVLSLTIAGLVHWIFIVLLLLKEAVMIAGGIYMANSSKMIRANIMGKIASATISAGVFLSYFHVFFAQKAFNLDWIILGAGILLTYVAFFNYLKQAIPIIRKIMTERKSERLKD
jgi:cardiolipin synthase